MSFDAFVTMVIVTICDRAMKNIFVKIPCNPRSCIVDGLAAVTPKWWHNSILFLKILNHWLPGFVIDPFSQVVQLMQCEPEMQTKRYLANPVTIQPYQRLHCSITHSFYVLRTTWKARHRCRIAKLCHSAKHQLDQLYRGHQR